jgi:hypothetical protein
MYFVTMFLKSGGSQHYGPFKDRMAGIIWAKQQSEKSPEWFNGRWSNEYMDTPESRD